MHEVQLTKLEAAYALKERDHAASAQESGAKELAKLVQEHASWREVLCEREEGKMQVCRRGPPKSAGETKNALLTNGIACEYYHKWIAILDRRHVRRCMQ